MFPTILGSVESALTIIDYAIKFAKFLSPSFRNFLEKTRAELVKIDVDATIHDANELFDRKLPTFVPISEVETLSWNLSHVLEVVQAVVEGLNMEKGLRGIKGLPTYGWAINFGLQKFTGKLKDWGFFLHSGKFFPATRKYDKSFFQPTQPMDQTDTYVKSKYMGVSLKNSAGLRRSIPIMLRFANTYFCLNAFHQLAVTNFSYFHPASDPTEYLELVGMSFYGFTANYSIVIRKGFSLSNSLLQVTLSNSDFEQLAAGLIADTLFYSDSVKRERSAAVGTLDRLYEMFKKK